jgi:hypothetical protein
MPGKHLLLFASDATFAAMLGGAMLVVAVIAALAERRRSRRKAIEAGSVEGDLPRRLLRSRGSARPGGEGLGRRMRPRFRNRPSASLIPPAQLSLIAT